MSAFFEWLAQFATNLWPLREVAPWEQGLRITCNRWFKDLGPGIYPVIPYLQEISTVTTVPSFFFTPMLTVTLQDGRTLSFTASAEVRVVDARKALLAVDKYHESVTEALSSMVADELIEANADAFSTQLKRRNLLKRIRESVNDQLERFGVELVSLRFANYAFPRTYRILQDASTSKVSW